MNMKNQKPGSRRYRFSVPDADESVIEWVQVQSNLSYSIRTLIKDYVSRRGYSDATCGQPGRKSPGRPTNEQRSRMEQVESAYSAPIASETYESIAPMVPAASAPTPVVSYGHTGTVMGAAPVGVSESQGYVSPNMPIRTQPSVVVSEPQVSPVSAGSVIDDMDDDMGNFFTKNRNR